MTNQPAQLIAIDPDALNGLIAEVKALRNEVRQARIKPANKWITIKEYAAIIGKSESTVNRHIALGKVVTHPETRLVANPNA
ncbi:hypothetical protein FEE96_17880 [Parasedimentitalea maritima]|uniref:DNA-binding protein n=1 Tax=Parasedimentitalea maritima TaxID=2578117 RepID=A0ABY2UQJ3_9RHOB|nr:hypothetical protein [Zongyanglinia marina]TLP58305.1 hypothetical protein FEE96_17880 [Zongyanglinia marina]